MDRTKCTPEVARAISSLISSGVPKTFAAQAGGIARSTLYNWIRKGEGPDAVEPYLSFVAEIRKGEAEQVARVSGVIMAAILDGDAHLGLKYLKMYHPRDFGDQPVLDNQIAPLRPLDLAASFAGAVQSDEGDGDG